MNSKIQNFPSDEIRKILKDFPEKLSKTMEILERETPIGILELSKYGWYLGYDSMPKTPIELGRKLKVGNSKEVDEILIKYFEETLDYIEKRIIARNPNRKPIIEESFENHRNKRYY